MKLAVVVACVVAVRAQTLPGTAPLTRQGDLAMEMVAGIDRYLMRELANAPAKRGAPSREELRRILGIVDERVASPKPLQSGNWVRWPVLPGLFAEGFLLKPEGQPKARAIVLPDLGTSHSREALELTAEGCEVLIPVLIDRADTWSGNPLVQMTNQPHREWVHRQLVPVGRHIIGLEVQKIMAAIDWFGGGLPVRIAGYGEGGIVAMIAAALDERIESALIVGAFEPRENVWQQPIYRSIWGQLLAHGDAEIASLIAPRPLVIEARNYPEIGGPSPDSAQRRGAAPGKLVRPAKEAIQREFARVKHPNKRLVADFEYDFVASPHASIGLGSYQRTAVEEMTEYAQRLVRDSDRARLEFAKGKDTAALRDHLWREVLGKLPDPSGPMRPETRRIYDKPAFTGYEVVLPVWPDVFAYGVLLLPKDLKPGEKRPVVVAQHGLDGRPQWLVEPPDQKAATVYQSYAAKLAERGFIVYAPQNPYIGDEKFRVLLRKAAPLKLSLFSFIIGQHQRTLEWLSSLPFVDSHRIGFYGLSYGGKTAMRVPSLLSQYSLSICSGDFNEWIWKVTSVQAPFSYMFTREYDMLEWNLANTFNYAEMVALIAPRPFMVERGHDDVVGIDEWVAYEYAKVRRMYNKAGIGDRTAIEFFNGGHMIHGQGTFDFLHRHLNWPKR